MLLLILAMKHWLRLSQLIAPGKVFSFLDVLLELRKKLQRGEGGQTCQLTAAGCAGTKLTLSKFCFSKALNLGRPRFFARPFFYRMKNGNRTRAGSYIVARYTVWYYDATLCQLPGSTSLPYPTSLDSATSGVRDDVILTSLAALS